MKRIVLMVFVLTTISTASVIAQPQQYGRIDKALATDSMTDTDDALTAFSDTVSAVSPDNSFQPFVDDEPKVDSRLNPENYSDPITYFAALWTAGIGGMLVALLFLFLLFLLLASPLIIIVLLIRYLMKRHNDNVMLAEKALDKGIAAPQKGLHRQSIDDVMWSKGIRNASIGIGLVLMFWMWNSGVLMGVGFLVLCYGCGQMVIARTSVRSMGKRCSANGESDGRQYRTGEPIQNPRHAADNSRQYSRTKRRHHRNADGCAASGGDTANEPAADNSDTSVKVYGADE